jgi:hypothetical protein
MESMQLLVISLYDAGNFSLLLFSQLFQTLNFLLIVFFGGTLIKFTLEILILLMEYFLLLLQVLNFLLILLY